MGGSRVEVTSQRGSRERCGPLPRSHGEKIREKMESERTLQGDI